LFLKTGVVRKEEILDFYDYFSEHWGKPSENDLIFDY
jgi:hypothetical protein